MFDFLCLGLFLVLTALTVGLILALDRLMEEKP